MLLFSAKNKPLTLFFKGDPEAVSPLPAISWSFHPAKICYSREKQQHMFLTAIWVQLYSQKQTHSEPALISKLLELPCNIIILQIYNSIGINKTNQTLKGFTFIHVVQQARRGAQKHPLYVILSVTHGFIYSVLHCTIYTSLLLSIQSL